MANNEIIYILKLIIKREKKKGESPSPLLGHYAARTYYVRFSPINLTLRFYYNNNTILN